MPETKKQGFSETYWNLHRNSLLFSVAWIAASLPGVCLSATQSWAFVTGHVWQPLLQLALATAALYSFVAFFLEWRHEALSQFRVEAGRSAGMPDQIERLIVEIGSAIGAADSARQNFSKALGSIDSTMKSFGGTTVNDGNALKPLVDAAHRDIAATLVAGLPKVVDYQRSNPLPVPDMLNHAEIAPALQSRLSAFAIQIARDVKYENASFVPDFQQALADMAKVVAEEGKISNELRGFEVRFADLRRALLRENALATARTWAIGIGAPALLFLTAISHGVGAWGIHILPFAPISELLGQPESCGAVTPKG